MGYQKQATQSKREVTSSPVPNLLRARDTRRHSLRSPSLASPRHLANRNEERRNGKRRSTSGVSEVSVLSSTSLASEDSTVASSTSEGNPTDILDMSEMSRKCDEFLKRLDNARLADKQYQEHLNKYDQQLDSIETRLSNLKVIAPCENVPSVVRKAPTPSRSHTQRKNPASQKRWSF